MIEETATVVDATDDYFWVEAKARSACSTCGSQSGCSTSSLSKLFGVRQQHIRLPNTLGSHAGEQVVIGVEDQVMVTASLAAYMQADGLHPNPEGVRLIVEGLGPKVEELLARVKG